MPENAEYIGPVIPQAGQLASIIAMVNRMFYSDKPFRVTDEFPWLFCRDALDRLRIFIADSQPVAHLAMVVNDASIYNCRVRVACLGAVCTEEAHRSKGLAGALVDDAVERAKAEGTAIMLISGNRSLYTRRGAYEVGRFLKFDVAAESLARPDGLKVNRLSDEDCSRALELYEAEPIHFCRTLEQYRSQISTGLVMNRQGKSYAVRRGENLSAVATVWYLCGVGDTAGPSVATVEFAGEREDLLAAVPEICRECGAKRAEIIAYTYDQDLLKACRSLGVEAEIVPFAFTVKLLDAQRLWRDFGPVLAARIGKDALANLRITSETDNMKINSLRFTLGNENFTINGAQEVLAGLFGLPAMNPLPQAQGRLGQELRRALPLAVPMYGLNFL